MSHVLWGRLEGILGAGFSVVRHHLTTNISKSECCGYYPAAGLFLPTLSTTPPQYLCKCATGRPYVEVDLGYEPAFY